MSYTIYSRESNKLVSCTWHPKPGISPGWNDSGPGDYDIVVVRFDTYRDARLSTYFGGRERHRIVGTGDNEQDVDEIWEQEYIRLDDDWAKWLLREPEYCKRVLARAKKLFERGALAVRVDSIYPVSDLWGIVKPETTFETIPPCDPLQVSMVINFDVLLRKDEAKLLGVVLPKELYI